MSDEKIDPNSLAFIRLFIHGTPVCHTVSVEQKGEFINSWREIVSAVEGTYAFITYRFVDGKNSYVKNEDLFVVKLNAVDAVE